MLFVLAVADKLYGPFTSASQAAEWAKEELTWIGNEPVASWSIRPLMDPAGSSAEAS